MLLVLHFGLIDLLGVLFIFLVGLLLEVPPLVNHLIELLLEAVPLDHLFLLLVEGITQLDLELCDLVVAGIHDGLVLLAKGFDESVVPLFAILGLLSDILLKTGYLA